MDVPDDLEFTDDIDVIKKAIEDINVANLAVSIAEKTADTKTDDDKNAIRFDPPWRTSESGTSCYADKNKFVDLKEGKNGGGALELIARESKIITSCGSSIGKDEYWKAVAELRKEGYDIPRYSGYKGTHPDGLGLYDNPKDEEDKKRKVLRALKASKRST